MNLRRAFAALGGFALTFSGASALAQNPLVTGKKITTPPVGKTVSVGNLTANLVLSPDGKFAVSTNTGFQEYLSVIDTTTGALVSQVDFNNGLGGSGTTTGLYYGLAFDPAANADGSYTLYAAQGGYNKIAAYTLNAAGKLTAQTTIATKQQANPLPGAANALSPSGDFAAGLALDKQNRLYVTNATASAFVNGAISQTPVQPTIPLSALGGPAGFYLNLNIPHASLSVIDRASGTELGRYTFLTDPVGLYNFPFAVAALNDGSKTYVGSLRDGAVYVLNTSAPAKITLQAAIVTGSHPLGLLLNAAQDTLYVANANSDTITAISTATDTISAVVNLRPNGAKGLPGVTPTNLALSPDGKTLYATLSDMNAVAVIDAATLRIKGEIPVGWYPSGVVATGSNILVSNAKGTATRYPNPKFKTQIRPTPADYDQTQYDLVAINGNVETIVIPSALKLLQYTQQVLSNNGITPTLDAPASNPLAAIGINGTAPNHIKHVIYIVKENRTFDQVMGDLGTDVPGVNADPSLVLFDKSVTPNQHAIMKRFVTLDNFYNGGEVSSDGWTWCTGSYANETVIKSVPYNYSGRPGRQDDSTGQNNGYIVGGHPAKDVDGKALSLLFPNGAPAITDVDQGAGGHIWDLVNAAGLSYRNYGFFLSSGAAPLLPDNYPCVPGNQPEGHDLAGKSDYDFFRFDTGYADSDAPSDYGVKQPISTYGKHKATNRFQEWNTEFQEMIAKDSTGFSAVPNFMTVRFMRDHTAGFSIGQNTPKAMVADNDYAVGELVQAISQYPDLWKSTAIFIVEDDSQDGPDHVDCHRSTGYVISPWIKANSLDHNFYNTDSMLHTMELLLGLPSMTQYDAIAPYIADWDTAPNNAAPFVAIEPASAIIGQLAQVKGPKDPLYWLAALSAKMDFKHADAADPLLLNEIIWKSVKGVSAKVPAPKNSPLYAKMTAKKAAQAAKTAKAKVKTVRKDDDD